MSKQLRLRLPILASILIIVAMACGCDSAGGVDRKTLIKKEQYINEGRDLFAIYCANCHGPKGKGLAELFPPLEHSDYLQADINRAICISKNGVEGEITINGTIYDLAMPANEKLTNLEIAEIMTFVLNEMNGLDTLLLVNDVEKVLQNCQL